MNAKIKERWIKALRSGKYKQGRKALRKAKNPKQKSEFCCLGVLCDLAVRSKVIPKPQFSSYFNGYSYAGGFNFLPPEVASWAGLDSVKPRVLYGSLHHLNDHGVGFEELADLIEKEL